MSQIEFSRNWNNKLNCFVFTTIRPSNPNRYVLSQTYDILLNKSKLKQCKIIKINRVTGDKLTDYVCYLDTGYDSQATRQILSRMYSNQDINTMSFDIIFLQTIKESSVKS